MTFARAAQRAIEIGGKYDGHDFPRNAEGVIQLNEMTVAAVNDHLVGQGLVGVGRDNYGGNGTVQSSVVTFAVIELDRETGMFDVKEWLSVADCGTVLNPRSLEAQTFAGGLQGMSQARFERWAFDPRWGLNQNRRFYTVKPFSMLDIPEKFDFAAVNIPDPETPVGSRGIGEPPVGAGAGVIISAIYDAVGVAVNRTPVTPDKILAALEGAATGYSLLQTHV
jgi:xanthine dehydrogenase molybdenum-binding subunit